MRISVALVVCAADEALSPCSRPRTMDDVAEQEEVVRVLKRTLESNNVRFLAREGL